MIVFIFNKSSVFFIKTFELKLEYLYQDKIWSQTEILFEDSNSKSHLKKITGITVMKKKREKWSIKGVARCTQHHYLCTQSFNWSGKNVFHLNFKNPPSYVVSICHNSFVLLLLPSICVLCQAVAVLSFHCRRWGRFHHRRAISTVEVSVFLLF